MKMRVKNVASSWDAAIERDLAGEKTVPRDFIASALSAP
jgi:hypothetical protein